MLNTTTGYALRTLLCLSQVPKGESLTGQELARRAGVPANYLSKLLLSLRNAGIVSAVRGSGGGYRLRPLALTLPLLDFVELFEGTRAKPACILGQDFRCSDDDPCPAHNAWRGVREQYLAFLQNTTLADIAHYPMHKFRSSDGTDGDPSAV